ncbi:UDP-glucose 4-epimerase [Roseovarius sp. MBR-78]|jgi:nucleoside-diphosphate-sugar epimerase|uniref:NAD-dependent epimerase/dehydratase family protein n=1 Tax=Roseovarius sp. MBR-78 TaxID=3156460 RepID=UPI00339A1C7F
MAKADDHILLTGASGRVGRMVLRSWPQGRQALTAQYRRPHPGALCWDPLDGPGALLAHADRAGRCFGAVVALAGVVPGPGRDLSLNRTIAEATVDAAAQAGITRVILASSSAVYGAGEAMDEDAPPAPVNAYGAAKREMETACAPWRARGMEICCLRIGNVAGADALLLNVAGGHGALVIDRFADGGGPVRSYIGPATLAAVLATLCRHADPLPDVLNIAAPVPVAMTALAQAAGARYETRPAPPEAHQRITLDCRRLAALHHFAPKDSTAAEMVRQWHASSAA